MNRSNIASNTERSGSDNELGLVVGVVLVAFLFLVLVIIIVVRSRQHWKQHTNYKLSLTLEQEPYSLATLSRRFSEQSGQDRRQTARSPSGCGTPRSPTSTTRSQSSGSILRSKSNATCSPTGPSTLPLHCEHPVSKEDYSEPLSFNQMYGSQLPPNATFPQMQPSISSTSSPCTRDHNSPTSPFSANFHFARPSVSSSGSVTTVSGYGMLDRTAPRAAANVIRLKEEVENLPYKDMTGETSRDSKHMDYMDMTGEKHEDRSHTSLNTSGQMTSGIPEYENIHSPGQQLSCRQNSNFEQTVSDEKEQYQGTYVILTSGKGTHGRSMTQLTEPIRDSTGIATYENISTTANLQACVQNINTCRSIPFPVTSTDHSENSTDDTGHSHQDAHV